jgi:histidyl-tRNA synthetase
MAIRRYLEDAWRRVSVRHGFEEVDGPIFESLELFKVKSGEGIVSELFHFMDRGERELAIRPEITPTIARMVAERANALPRPIKWFCVPNLCRAEKPQRGRAREFWQWNVDFIGSDSPVADAEVMFTCVELLRELGLNPDQVRLKISHRETVRTILAKLGVPEDKMLDAFDLLDRRDKIEPAEFMEDAMKLGLDEYKVERFEQMCRRKYPAGDVAHLERSIGVEKSIGDLEQLDNELSAFGIAPWCEYDLGIVRGLAYYTGTVFEVHEISGAERALAGGGRYDRLIELMGGPAMPAVGFGMGDVVLSLVLTDKQLLPEHLMPPVDAFIIAAEADQRQPAKRVVADLRRAGLHVRFSYRTTTNVGKLLKDADACAARFAIILDGRTSDKQTVGVKDLGSGQQQDVQLDDLVDRIAPASAAAN